MTPGDGLSTAETKVMFMSTIQQVIDLFAGTGGLTGLAGPVVLGFVLHRRHERKHQLEKERLAVIRHVIDEHGPDAVQGLKDVL